MTEVLLITRPIAPPWDEGSKNIAWMLASNLSGYQFHLLSAHDADFSRTLEHINFNNIYSSKKLNRIQQLRLLIYLLASNITTEYDIYHSLFVPTPVTSYVLRNFTRMNRYPSIQTIPSLPATKQRTDLSSLLFSDRIVTISDWTTKRLSSSGFQNITKINVGIDLQNFSPTKNKFASRRRYGIYGDDLLILYSGELTRLGSLDMMLSIVPRVLKQSDNTKFVFASPTRSDKGRKARKAAVKSIQRMGFAGRVYFLGDVEDFRILLDACDIFVYPVSTMSGKFDTPLTVLEAMAMELPIIISDLPPLNEILLDEAGFAVASGDEDAFIDAVLELSSNPSQRERMGKIARMIVQDHFNLKKMVGNYGELYNEIR